MTVRRLFAWVALLLMGNSLKAQEVAWHKEYSTARLEAVEKARPLVLTFTSQDCRWCVALDSTTYRDPTITQLIADRFVPLKVEAEVYPNLVKALGIQGFPTIVVASASGRIIEVHRGYIEPAPFAELLGRALTKLPAKTAVASKEPPAKATPPETKEPVASMEPPNPTGPAMTTSVTKESAPAANVTTPNETAPIAKVPAVKEAGPTVVEAGPTVTGNVPAVKEAGPTVIDTTPIAKQPIEKETPPATSVATQKETPPPPVAIPEKKVAAPIRKEAPSPTMVATQKETTPPPAAVPERKAAAPIKKETPPATAAAPIKKETPPATTVATQKETPPPPVAVPKKKVEVPTPEIRKEAVVKEADPIPVPPSYPAPPLYVPSSPDPIVKSNAGETSPVSPKITPPVAVPKAATEPAWMAEEFRRAAEAVGRSEFPRAVALLRNLVKDDIQWPAQARAAGLLREIERQAATRLTRVKEAEGKGEVTEAIRLAQEIVSRYDGTEAASEALAMVSTLSTRLEDKDRDRMMQAQAIMKQANEDFRAGQWLPCLLRCEDLQARFSDLSESVKAGDLIAKIKSNPSSLQRICDGLPEVAGQVYLTMAEVKIKQGEPQQAMFFLERVLQAFPSSKHAEMAQVRLSQIQGPPPVNSLDDPKE